MMFMKLWRIFLRAELIVLFLLITAAAAEIIYTIFRTLKFSSCTVIIYSAAILFSLYSLLINPGFSGAAKLSSLILLMCAKAFMKNKPYEKPDWRYLLILAGVLFIHI